MNLGASEIALILLVVLVLFGGKRLPDLARNIGKGLAEFRRVTQSFRQELNAPLSDIPDRKKPEAQRDSDSQTEQKVSDIKPDTASQPRSPEEKSGQDTGSG